MHVINNYTATSGDYPMLNTKLKFLMVSLFVIMMHPYSVTACDIIFGDGFSIYELKRIHQWRFNEVGGSVLKDEDCGSDAHIIDVGNSNAVVLNGSVYVNGGAKDSSDYIKLPDNILSGLANTTIEIWASNESTTAWARIFDFGSSTNDFLMMSWTRFDIPNTDRVQWVSTSSSGFITDDSVGNYGLNTQRHIVITIEDLIPGVISRAYWYVDGVYKGLGTMNGILADIGQSNNFLARSKFPDPTANVQYDEVNIYNGIMTDDKVMQRYLEGPNNTPKVTAATYYPGNQKFYLFSGTQYYRQGAFVDPGYPRSIFTFWDGWTPSWGIGDLDAITYNANTNKYYLFWNNEFIVHTHANAPDAGYPKTIVGNWSGWPAGWGSGELDAAAYNPVTNKYYLFKGSEFVSHSPGSPPDAGYPKPIAGNWSGWPTVWGIGDIDAIIYYPPTGIYFLFKGDEYVSHSHGQPHDPGQPYPTEIGWFAQN
jgi:hypothetical protein